MPMPACEQYYIVSTVLLTVTTTIYFNTIIFPTLFTYSKNYTIISYPPTTFTPEIGTQNFRLVGIST